MVNDKANNGVQLILGRLLHAIEENQKALDRLEERELDDVKATTQMRADVERLRKDVEAMSSILRGKNGDGLISRVGQSTERIKVLQRQKFAGRKWMVFAASPGVLSLIDISLKWLNR